MSLVEPTDSLIFLFSFSMIFSFLDNINTSKILYSLIFSSFPISILFYNRFRKANSIDNKKKILDKIIKSQMKSSILIEKLFELKQQIYKYSPLFYKEILFLCICIDDIKNTTTNETIKYDISMIKTNIKNLNNTISSLIFNVPKLDKKNHDLFKHCLTEIQNESHRILSILCERYQNHWESNNIDKTDSPNYLTIPHSNTDENNKILRNNVIYL